VCVVMMTILYIITHVPTLLYYHKAAAAVHSRFTDPSNTSYIIKISHYCYFPSLWRHVFGQTRSVGHKILYILSCLYRYRLTELSEIRSMGFGTHTHTNECASVLWIYRRGRRLCVCMYRANSIYTARVYYSSGVTHSNMSRDFD